jgi:hypothetical protein
MTMANAGARKARFPTPLDAWRGRASLFVVFWGYGVLFSAALIAAFLAALYRGDTLTQQALLPAFGVYTAWVLVSVWRCAAGARAPWGMMAQLLTVAWAGNAILVTGFLQLRLLESYLGA